MNFIEKASFAEFRAESNGSDANRAFFKVWNF